MGFIFCKLKKLKKHDFFLQAKKAQETEFNFLQAQKTQKT